MRKRSLSFSFILFMVLAGVLYSLNSASAQAAGTASSKTLVLYDAASGTVPGEALMDFTDFPPGAALQSYSEGAVVLDTTLSGRETYAGWVSGQAITAEFPSLDAASGVQLEFTLQVESEIHGRNNRAGFNVILLDQGARGVEMAFWEDEIWVQNDDQTGGLFTRGEGAVFATTSGPVRYQITLLEDTYALTANAAPILTGPIRDYSSFDGFPDPYETPDFLFMGDDTTSAQARIRLGFVSVTGAGPVQAVVTDTSTSSPVPSASFTPLPATAPIPSPTPVSNSERITLCPSGWLLVAVTFTGFLLKRKFG